MTITAIILIIISAFIHAAWNFITKCGKPSSAFFVVANTAGCVVLAPFAIFHCLKYSLFPSHVWLLILLTGTFMTLYYAALAGAYRSGDMSLAYPLARSSPVIVVAVVTFILGQGETISRSCVLGILLVVAGCFMVPMRTFRDFRLKNYLCPTCALAFLAAVGTAGYSITDAEALADIRNNLDNTQSITVMTMLYAFMEAVSVNIFLSLYVFARKPERAHLIQVLKTNWRTACLAGVGIYLTYTLVLISMSLARNVSYVVGFRQLSIPLGVIMGIIFLKEKATRPKIVGVITLVTGLILIATG